MMKKILNMLGSKQKQKFKFFLGGDDAEMRLIRQHLEEAGVDYVDAGLGWGAKASDYGPEAFAQAERDGFIPVLVELEVDCNLPETAVVIDHHGDRSGEPPAIIQVLNLLGITPSRHDILTGAMDAGFVFGLESIGATKEEIADFLGGKAKEMFVRYKRESAELMNMGSAATPMDPYFGPSEPTLREMLLAVESGLDDEVIAEAERAVAAREYVGDMIVVRCGHSKTAPITARLVGDQAFQNILILSSDGEVNHYGTGETVREIRDRFPDGWSGGAGLMPHTPEAQAFWEQWGGSAPSNAFWGGYPDHAEILEFLSEKFS